MVYLHFLVYQTGSKWSLFLLWICLEALTGAESSSPFILSSLWGVGQVGQIRLEKFVARTQQDVAAAVQSLAAEGAQEYVLDLRNNLGGLVEEGVEVARLFLDGNSRTAELSSNQRKEGLRLPGCS